MNHTRTLDPHGNLQEKLPTERLAAYIAAGALTPSAGHSLAGADATVLDAGWHKHAPTTITTDFAIVYEGAFGGAVIELDITDAASVNGAALLDLPANIGTTENKFASISRVEGVALDGNANDMADGATRLIHGVRMVAAAADNQGRVPTFERFEIRNFSGVGLAALGNWNQARMINGKITDCRVGLQLDSCQDSKFWGLGIGANTHEQVTMTACSTPMFTNVDFWAPSGARFQAQYGVVIDGGYGARFVGCDMEVPIKIDGQNNLTATPGSSSSRHRWLFHTFDGCFFKVSTDISEGYATHHNGDAEYQTIDGQYAPKSFFRVEDASGLHVVNCHWSFGNNLVWTSDTPPLAAMNARPDFLFGFRSFNNEGNAALQQDRRGIVKIVGDMEVCNFQGKQTASSAGYPVRKPIPLFKRHISNDPTRIDWDGLRPKLILDALAGPRYIKADGATGVTVEDNPIAYLATDPTPGTRHLQDLVATFTMPNMTAPLAGYGWYFRRW